MKLAKIGKFRHTRGLDNARNEIGKYYYVQKTIDSTWVNEGETYMIMQRKDGVPTNLINCVISSKDLIFGKILNA